MNDILKLIPEMKAGDALISALSVLPAYDENIRSQNEAVRLIALSDLSRIGRCRRKPLADHGRFGHRFGALHPQSIRVTIAGIRQDARFCEKSLFRNILRVIMTL